MAKKMLGILVAVLALGMTLAVVTATAKPSSGSTTSVNNGGGTPNCGNSCDQSHNPTDFEKPCRPVPGNGCHTLPDTPCERGHGGTEIGNKHCLPSVTMVKEQKLNGQPDSSYTRSVITAPLNFSQIDYRITVHNNTSTVFSLNASDPNCTTSDFSSGLTPSGVVPLGALGTVVYTCNVDVLPGIGDPVVVPADAVSGDIRAPWSYTNTASVAVTRVSDGLTKTLSASVTATITAPLP